MALTTPSPSQPARPSPSRASGPAAAAFPPRCAAAATPDFDWRADAIRSYELWAAAKREEYIRAGGIDPQTDEERTWAAEGPVPVKRMEAGRR